MIAIIIMLAIVADTSSVPRYIQIETVEYSIPMLLNISIYLFGVINIRTAVTVNTKTKSSIAPPN